MTCNYTVHVRFLDSESLYPISDFVELGEAVAITPDDAIEQLKDKVFPLFVATVMNCGIYRNAFKSKKAIAEFGVETLIQEEL